jgi:hypothetical protein
MRVLILVLLSLAVFVYGCGGDETQTVGEETTPPTTTTVAAGSCRGNLGKKAPVKRGRVVPNSGAFGVALGMSRPEVIACLGPPLLVSENGVLSYGGRGGEADVWFKDKRVALIYVSFPGSFCLRHRICVGKRNALTKLRRHYKGTCESESGEEGREVIVLPGLLNGRKVLTTFYPSTRNTFLDLDIAFASDSPSLPCNA